MDRAVGDRSERCILGQLSADRLGGDVQKWLDESVMAQDTAETERDQTEFGGEG